MRDAVFVVVEIEPCVVAATTRASDRGEAGKIGLPGGKVDPGETLVQAVIRESHEEGWDLFGVDRTPFYTQIVDDFRVYWFKAKSAVKLDRFKEMHRIQPIAVSAEDIAKSGYGNDNAMRYFV